MIGSMGRGLLAPLLLIACLGLATASHFRYSHISWTRSMSNPLLVTFVVNQGWRTGSRSNLNLNMGDGNTFTATSANVVPQPDAEYVLYRDVYNYTYPSAGVFTVSYASGDRVDSVNGGGTFAASMVVDLSGSDTGSMAASLPAYVLMQVTGGVQTLPLLASDPDGAGYTCALSALADSGIYTQPTIGSNVAYVDGSCNLKWDTTGGTIGQKYAVQVQLTSIGSATSTFIDFLIGLSGPLPTIALTAGSAANTVNVGDPMSCQVTATGVTGTDTLTFLAATGFPSTGTFNPAVGTSGTGSHATTFAYTAVRADMGGAFVGTVFYQDQNGNTVFVSVSITVPMIYDPPSPPPPSPSPPPPSPSPPLPPSPSPPPPPPPPRSPPPPPETPPSVPTSPPPPPPPSPPPPSPPPPPPPSPPPPSPPPPPPPSPPPPSPPPPQPEEIMGVQQAAGLYGYNIGKAANKTDIIWRDDPDMPPIKAGSPLQADGKPNCPDDVCGQCGKAWRPSLEPGAPRELSLFYRRPIRVERVDIYEVNAPGILRVELLNMDNSTITIVNQTTDATPCPGWLNTTAASAKLPSNTYYWGIKVVVKTTQYKADTTYIDSIMITGWTKNPDAGKHRRSRALRMV